LKSSGSVIAIVDPAQEFEVLETFGRGARLPIFHVLGILEPLNDRECGAIHTWLLVCLAHRRLLAGDIAKSPGI
jgi:hypothetical protein